MKSSTLLLYNDDDLCVGFIVMEWELLIDGLLVGFCITLLTEMKDMTMAICLGGEEDKQHW